VTEQFSREIEGGKRMKIQERDVCNNETTKNRRNGTVLEREMKRSQRTGLEARSTG